MAAVLLLLFTLTGYARRALFNSDQFANRAAATLQNDSVRNVVAQRVTDELVLKNEADLLAARPLIQSAVAGIVGSSAFRSLFDRAVRDVHRAIFHGDQNTATLALADVGTVAGAALEKLQPTVAAKLEQNRKVTLFQRHLGDGTGGLARWTNRARALSWLLAGLTLAAMAGAIALSADRRRTVSRLGIGVASVGVLIVIAYTIARAVVLAQLSDPADRAAAAGVWSSFIGDLRTWGWVLAGSGAIVAAAAASLIHPVEIEGALRRVWRIITVQPERTWLRVGRALGLVAAGALVIAQPLTALQVAATLVGVYLVYLGVEAILRMTYRAPLPDAERPPVEPPHRWRRRAVPALAALLVALALTIFLTSGGASEPAVASSNTCNGYQALCDKTLKDVVLPATHNSMSVPLPGWYSSEQEAPIGRQLEDGIRGLLIDTHYGDKLPKRQGAHGDRERGGHPGAPQAGRHQPAGVPGGHADTRPARVQGQRQARHVPLPQLLRARGRAAGRRPPGDPRLPRDASRQRARGDQPGLRHARGLREGGGRGRPDPVRLPGPRRRAAGRRCGR